MRGMGKWAPTIIAVLLAVMVAAAAATEAPTVVLTGEINDIYQLVTEDGEIYEIGINEVGNELVDNQINEKVRVKGKISTAEDGARIITVESFERIAK